MKKWILAVTLASVVPTTSWAGSIWEETFDDARIAHQSNGVSWLWDGTERIYNPQSDLTHLGNDRIRADSWALGGTPAHVAIANGVLGIGNVTDKYRAAATVLGAVSDTTQRLRLQFDIVSLGSAGFNGVIEVWTNSEFTGIHNDVQWIMSGGKGEKYGETTPYGISRLGMVLANSYDVDAGTTGTKSIDFNYPAGAAIMLRFASDSQVEGDFAFTVGSVSLSAVTDPTMIGTLMLGWIGSPFLLF